MIRELSAKEYWNRCFYHPYGTLDTKELLSKSDEEIKNLYELTISYRYNLYEPEQKGIMEIEEFYGKKVLEIGSGAGIDALTMAKHGAKVTCCDIVNSNIELCKRLFSINGLDGNFIVSKEGYDKEEFPDIYDIVYAYGVLHHIPEAKNVVDSLKKYTSEFIVMLYTDKLQRDFPCAVNEGVYTTFYDLESTKRLFSDWKIVEFTPFHSRYYVKVKSKKELL